MNKLLATCTLAVLAVGYQAGAQAQPLQPNPPGMMARSTLLQNADGLVVYDREGNILGTIVAVDADERGNEGAVVSTSMHLGMGVSQVLIPSASLAMRPDGNFVTRLGHSAIEAEAAFRHDSSGPEIQ